MIPFLANYKLRTQSPSPPPRMGGGFNNNGNACVWRGEGFKARYVPRQLYVTSTGAFWMLNLLRFLTSGLLPDFYVFVFYIFIRHIGVQLLVPELFVWIS
jgi:hypothetical protein